MATRTERSVFRTGATRGSTKGAHCRRDGIVRGTGPIHRGSEATDAIAARSHSCPRPMRPRRARIHGANAETPAASARMVRGHGEMRARPARTHMSRAALNPSTGQLAGVPPRIDRGTEATHRRIAGTLSALARTQGHASGIVPVADAFTAMRRECLAVPRESNAVPLESTAVRRECIAVVGHCIHVPRELLRVTLE